jgi:hypothetical protein
MASMSSPRFRPRIYASDQRSFGKAQEIAWATVDNIDDQGMASVARFQHYFALRIRQRLRERKLSLAMFATMSGQSYDRLIKVQRGDTVMKLEEVFRAELLLGNVIDPGGTPLHKFAAELTTTV